MQTELETLIAQCTLTLSLTRRAGSMRLAVLQRWAAAHGLRVPPPLPLMAAAAPPATLASPSIGALICFYAECIARLEAKPGAASLLRATVLDASLVPHAVRSAATLTLCGWEARAPSTMDDQDQSAYSRLRLKSRETCGLARSLLRLGSSVLASCALPRAAEEASAPAKVADAQLGKSH
jgi:hypothetical protein